MPVLTPIARPLLASIFIMQGLDNLLRPERVAPLVEPILRPLADRLPGPPARAEQAVRAKGALHLVAGSMLAFGRWPRLTSLTLAATMVPTTLAAHRFWEATDEAERLQKRIHFVKNLSISGGLLIAAGHQEARFAGRRVRPVTPSGG
jgi:uncharacterized membrane protein YphA (DoxX/SURF4 family)